MYNMYDLDESSVLNHFERSFSTWRRKGKRRGRRGKERDFEVFLLRF
jgi:hypothetical protein